MLQTTGGGIYGDTEGDDNETFTMPDPPHSSSPKGRKRKQAKGRGGEVAKVDLKIALKMGVRQMKEERTILVKERIAALTRKMISLMRS